MAQNYKAGLIITGDASGGIRAIRATDDELGKLNKGFSQSSRNSRQFGNDAERAGQQVREIGHGSTEASKGLTLVRQAATLAMAAFSVRQLATYADGWSELNSRVLNVTKDMDVSEQTMKRLAETARGTYSSLNQTAEAYLNNATTLTELGYSTERQLDLSDALNNSLVISATRGQQAESVMNALSKAFAAGELRGDNFNTVIQSGGRMAEALADGLGVTTIQLREMAAAGELTTTQVFEALTSQMEVLRREAAEMPATIEDGWTLIGNASMELVGRLDKAFGASEGIAGVMVYAADTMTAAIDPLIDNMDTIQDVAVLTATVVAGRYAAAFATSARNVAANTAQTVANTRANVAATTVARAKAAEVLRVAQAEQAAAARALANGHAIAAATGNTTLRSKAITQMAAANQRAIAAEAAHTTAVNANAAAMQRSTASAYAMAAASRAASGALALIGGPVGAAVLAGTAAYYFRDSLGFTSAAARETKQDIDQLIDSLDSYTHAQYQSNRVSIVQGLAEARIEAEKLSRQILDLQDQANMEMAHFQGAGSGRATRELRELRAELLDQQRVVRSAEEGLREYDRTWQQVLEGQISGVSIYRTLDQWLMTTGDSASENARRFNALGDSLGESGEKWDDYIGKLQAARDVMGMTAAESAQYAAAQAGYTGLYADQAAAVAGQTDALSDYQKAVADGNETEAQAHLARAQRYAEAEAMVQAQLQNIGTLTTLLQGVQTELSATALSAALVVGDGSGAAAANVAAAIEAINNRAAAIRNTTTVTVKNTSANREASKAAREAEQAAQKQADALQSIREEMDPLLREHATYVDRITVLEKALGAGTITQKDFGEAVRWSAEQYTRAASGAEDYENQTESLVGKYDAHNQRAKLLRTELDQINQRYRAGIIDGAQYGRMVQNVREDMDQLAKEADGNSDRIAQSFTTWGTVADNTLRSVDDAGRDAWLGLVDGSTSARETIERGFEQTLANIAHMLTTQKLTFHVAGFMGMDTTGMPGGGGGGFNLGSMGSMRNGWQAVQSGVGNIQWTGAGGQQAYGGGWANAATQGTGASGYLGGSMQNFSGMQGLASAGTGIAGGYAGTQMGQSLFGKNAGSSWGATGGAVAGTYFGGPLGAAIGGAIGGALDAAFGKSKKTFDFDFEQGKHSYVFGDGTSAFGDYGLTGLSDYKLGEQQDELKAMLASLGEFDNQLAAAAIPERFDAMREAIDGFTHSGAGDLFETRLRAMITGGEVWAAEAVASVTDPEKLSQAMLGALQLEQLGGVLGTELSEQIKAAMGAARGDYAAEVVQSTLAQAQAAGALINASSRLNLQFDQTAAGALSAAGSLAQYVGGVDSLTAANNAYYQAAFSEQERLQHSYDDVRQSLGEITGEAPRTVGELRALVEAQSLNGDASQRLVADLMALAPALADTTAAVRQAIEQQYQSALGRAPADSGLDYWFNLVAEGSITLEGALWNIANSAEAAEAAANGAASSVGGMSDALRARDQLNRQLLQAEGKTGVLRQMEIDRLTELETAEVDNLAAMQRRLYAIEDEKAAQQEAQRAQQERTRAIQQEAQAMARARDQLAGFGNTISGWVSQRDASENGGGSPRDRLEASDADFWAQYQKALQGDRNAQQGLTQYADRYIDNLQSMYASSAPAAAGIEEVRDAMARLPDMLSPEQFLADEFKGALGEQTVSLANVLDLNGSGMVSAIEQTIAADWSTTDLLASVLNTEMNRLGTTVLTESQVRAALGPHATDAEIDRLIQRVDVNGDGVINRQELTNARLSGLSVGIASAVAQEFDSLDLSGDELIDYDEFRKAFAGMATDSELSRIFDKLDATGTGTISRLDAQTNELITAAKARDLTDTQREIIGALNAQQNESVVRWWGHHYANEMERKFSGHRGLGVSLASKQDESGVNFMGRVFADRMLSRDNTAWLGHQIANEFKRAGVGNSGKAYAEGGYTGPGGKYQPAGMVHAGEVVWSQDDIARAGGVDNVEALRMGTASAAVLQMQLPDAPLPMPAPVLPMSQHPLLDQNDQVEAWRDLLNENRQLRQDVNRLLGKIEQHTGAGVAVQQEGFKQQINEQRKGNRSLDDMSAAARLEGSR